MTSEEMHKFGIEKYGDQLALRAFLCNITSDNPNETASSNHTEGLLKRIKKKLEQGTKDRKSKILKGSKHAAKDKRKVEGSDVRQVRAKKGGGTRSASVQVEEKMELIQELAIKFFFPHGLSVLASVDDFLFSMCGYDTQEISPSMTLDQLYKRTQMRTLRIYLHICPKSLESSVGDEISVDQTDE